VIEKGGRLPHNCLQADAAAPIPGVLSNWAVINLVAPVRPPANQPNWAVYNTSSVSGCLMSNTQGGSAAALLP
jgi:hypothetical protein